MAAIRRHPTYYRASEPSLRAVHHLPSWAHLKGKTKVHHYDTPALAAATCGMAMGVAGSDAAIEAVDIAPMADDLLNVEEALGFGHKARHVSAQNIAFSLLILATMISFAVIGVIGVALTVLVHEASELLAVANGLRAGRLPAPPSDVQGKIRL